MTTRHALATMLFLFGGLPLSAQPPAPPPPAQFQTRLRYEIIAGRNDHVLQYDAMIAHLKRLGFQFEPPLEDRPDADREDPSKNYLEGKIPSSKILEAFDNPAIRTLLIDAKTLKEHLQGDDLEKPVRVRLELPGGFALEAQKVFVAQVRLLLKEQGFREAIGYDNRGYTLKPYTRLVGTVPTRSLETLLKDLRKQPAGWFSSNIIFNELPIPMKSVTPIRIIEVLPDSAPIIDVEDPPQRGPEFLEKISADLWALVQIEEKKNQKERVQIIFAGKPEPDQMRKLIEDHAPGSFIEGQLGQVTTVEVAVSQIKALAEQSLISVIRKPQPAHVEIDSNLSLSVETAKVLEKSGLKALHAKGSRGKGIRIAVVDSDFRNWEKLVEAKKLPMGTRLIDLTAERDVELLPAPYSEGDFIGHGAQSAAITALAAPEAEFLLVRFHPQDPYQVQEIIQYLQRETISHSLGRRSDEMETQREYFGILKAQLAKERQKILDDFVDETDLAIEYGFWGPAFGWVFSDRSYHRLKAEYQTKLDRELADRERRLSKLIGGIRDLKGCQILIDPFVWNQGFPLGSTSPLSQWIDENNLKQKPLIFQATANTRGQAWNDLFRDTDNNGLMEFVSHDAPLKPGQWNHELNFLGWQPHLGKLEQEIPAQTRIRLTLQWREAHHPDYYLRPGEDDYYLRPLSHLRIAVLRQRDPKAEKIPADSFDLVAKSSLYPQRLDHRPEGSVYEHILEMTIDKPGRYALRIERLMDWTYIIQKSPDGTRTSFQKIENLSPQGTRPLFAPALPALDKTWELKPALFAQAIDEASRKKGRLTLADYATDLGSLGLPADARSVIAVGAASLDRRLEPFSAIGPPAFLELAKTPTLFAYDQIGPEKGPAFGSTRANAFAAGMAASLLSSGMTSQRLAEMIRQQPGTLFHVPEEGKK